MAANSFLRLLFDLAMKVQEDQPDLLLVQYTAPLGCTVPVVVAVHDVSFLQHPEYFARGRACQLRMTVGRTVRRAAKILTGTEAARDSILKVYGDLDKDKVAVVPYAAAPEFRRISREAAMSTVGQRGRRVAQGVVGNPGPLQARRPEVLVRLHADVAATQSAAQSAAASAVAQSGE